MAGDADRAWVDTMPAAYDRWLVPTVFQPFAVDLARRAAARPVGAALELAAGTGVLTRELLGVATAVTATDLNDAMVDLGARQVPAARWRQADATRLPFDDAAFDLVACQFGVMFFPDRPAAYAEAVPKKKAQDAIMRDQLVITHALLSDPEAGYRDLGTGYYEQRERTRRRASSHVRSLERLGYKVTIEPLTPDADPETGELITRTAV